VIEEIEEQGLFEVIKTGIIDVINDVSCLYTIRINARDESNFLSICQLNSPDTASLPNVFVAVQLAPLLVEYCVLTLPKEYSLISM